MSLFNLPPFLDWPAQFCVFTSIAAWVLSIITANVSQVDRLWTFLPTIYTAYYAFLPLLPNEQSYPLVPYAPKDLGYSIVKDFSPRALLMFGVIFIWMCRLSYNTYRRGLFSLKDEDYRWHVLRQQIHPILFQITNLTFIALTQNVLLLLLGLPAYVASVLQPHTPLATSDYVLAAVALTILVFEFTADNQQWAFHAYKHAHLAKEKLTEVTKSYDPAEHWTFARLEWTPNDAKRGFVTRGLWRYSRHPNAACEQAFWWVITLIPLLAPSPPHLPSLAAIRQEPAALAPALVYLAPPIALSLLIYSSTVFTEAISSSKYTEAYTAYQRRVGMFTPVETIVKTVAIHVIARPEKRTIKRLVWGAAHQKED
ncbi:hypothetical protein CPB84DRAFT_1813599 [Gymnopilus junonius]|uniref:DUF1295-domain-containing protein n=1 Tax=Gymnopilus junonius TaxID=109634 RepID=A0A9P5NUS7_GYMJU|nr:hypothetical protein CPB84DRAFT_1813599 [Gymnopilus junonius]